MSRVTLGKRVYLQVKETRQTILTCVVRIEEEFITVRDNEGKYYILLYDNIHLNPINNRFDALISVPDINAPTPEVPLEPFYNGQVVDLQLAWAILLLTMTIILTYLA